MSKNRKLSKNDIQFIKDLQKTKHRQETSSFLAEGRKTVESLWAAGARPLEVIMTQDSYNSLSSAVNASRQRVQDHQRSRGEEMEAVHSDNGTDLPKNTDTHVTIADVLKQHQLEQLASPKQRCSGAWSTNTHTGSLIPHSTSEEELSTTQLSTLKELLTRAQVIESSLMQRLSSFSSAPGLLCRFPFMSNIVHCVVNPADHEDSTGQTGDSNGATLAQHPLLRPFEKQKETRNDHQRLALGGQTVSDWNWHEGGVILTSMNDPGNLGTIVRTSHAFGVKQLLLVDTCDVYQPKTVAASMGALAGPRIVSTTGTTFLSFLEHCRRVDLHNLQQHTAPTPEDKDVFVFDYLSGTTPYLVGLTPTRGKPLSAIPSTYEEFLLVTAYEKLNTHQPRDLIGDDDISISLPKLSPSTTALFDKHIPSPQRRKPWLVVGSESHGIPPQIEDLLAQRMTISMNCDNLIGSLNASVAGSISIYELSQRLGQVVDSHQVKI